MADSKITEFGELTPGELTDNARLYAVQESEDFQLKVGDLKEDLVRKAGEQNITGVKTFTVSPKIPDAVNNNEPVSKQQLAATIAVATGAGQWAPSVEDLTELRAVVSINRVDGQSRLVESLEQTWGFEASSLAEEGDNVVRPSDIDALQPGRWLLRGAKTQNHESLLGLKGGAPNENYHLTEAQLGHLPSADEKAAMAGTGAAPSGTNRFVTGDSLVQKKTTAQRDALIPAAGDKIYNTDNKRYEFWNGVVWVGVGLHPRLIEVAVPAINEGWTDSGITLTALDSLVLTASGLADRGGPFPDSQPDPFGPNGDPSSNTINGLRRFSLVGVIMPSGTPSGAQSGSFFVGESKTWSGGAGRLFLRYNDVPSEYANNTGQYNVGLLFFAANSALVGHQHEMSDVRGLEDALDDKVSVGDAIEFDRTGDPSPVIAINATEDGAYLRRNPRFDPNSTALAPDPTHGTRDVIEWIKTDINQESPDGGFATSFIGTNGQRNWATYLLADNIYRLRGHLRVGSGVAETHTLLEMDRGGSNPALRWNESIDKLQFSDDGTNWKPFGGEILPKTTAERDALTPVAGDKIYNTDNKRYEFYNGVVWVGVGLHPRDSSIAVPATAAWTDTGITLSELDSLTVEASGTVVFRDDLTVGPGGSDGPLFNGLRRYGLVGVLMQSGTPVGAASAEVHSLVGASVTSSATIYGDVVVDPYISTLASVQAAIRAKPGRENAVVSGTITPVNLGANLALDGNLSADSIYPAGSAYDPPKAIDGQLNTYWISNLNNPPHWWQCEFPEPRAFNTVRWYPASAGDKNPPHAGKIQISDDGVTFTDVSEFSGLSYPDTDPHVESFDTVTALYVRIFITAVGPPETASSLTEVGVYNAASASVNITIQYAPQDGNVGNIEAIPGTGYIGTTTGGQGDSFEVGASKGLTGVSGRLWLRFNDSDYNDNSGAFAVQLRHYQALQQGGGGVPEGGTTGQILAKNSNTDYDTEWINAPSGGVGGGTGDVNGPASSTDNALVRMDGATGKIIQNSPITLSDAGALTVPEISAPATPSSGKVALYAKADGQVYSKSDAGIETQLGVSAGAGSVTSVTSLPSPSAATRGNLYVLQQSGQTDKVYVGVQNNLGAHLFGLISPTAYNAGYKPIAGTPVNTSLPISSGLVLACPWNENTGTTFADKSASPQNGTIATAGMWMGDATYDAVLNFTGDSASIPHATKYNIETFTISFAFKSSQPDFYGVLFAKTAGAAAPQTLSLGFPSIGKVTIQVYDGTNLPEATTVASTWNDNIWHKCIVTRAQGGAIKLYIDGVLLATATDTTIYGSTLNNGVMLFGAEYGTSRRYKGQIAHFHMWNRVLSGAPGLVGNSATGEIAAIQADEFAMYRNS